VRILYLADVRFPLERANGIQTMETCYALAERGHAVRLLVRPDTATPVRDPFEFYGFDRHERLEIVRAPVAGPRTVRRLQYLLRAFGAAVGSRRVDVVMTRDLGVASTVLRWPRAYRPPLIYESHGFAPVFAETMPELMSGARTASKAKLRRLASREKRVWRLAEGYAAITAGVAEELTGRFGAREALAIVPDGVRLDPQRRFSPWAASAMPTVVYVGHLYPWKGVDVFLRALSLLAEPRAIIVGGHPAEGDLGRLQSLARALGIDQRVRFTGLVPRNDVSRYLQQADVLVMPHTATRVSERYASPLKLFEYMAAGKPIVASDVPAVREVLRDGENACLVSPGDPQSLASGIARVLADRPLAERIAGRAFEEASSYTWARRAERLEQLFGTAMARS
jgi:glycosyltransferase involved in cell wall biosynthesis